MTLLLFYLQKSCGVGAVIKFFTGENTEAERDPLAQGPVTVPWDRSLNLGLPDSHLVRPLCPPASPNETSLPLTFCFL